MPEIILVGISYPEENANYSALSRYDLTPTEVENSYGGSGGAPKFLEFIEDTLIPYMETNYRADPVERGLGGASLGGLFTTYAMYEKPDLFKRFLAISPAVIWDKGYMFRRDNEFASTKQGLPVRAFTCYGGGEYSEFRNPIARFQKKLENREYEGLELLNWEVEGERHGGVNSEGWTRGLRWVFNDIAPDEPGPLETSFKKYNTKVEIME